MDSEAFINNMLEAFDNQQVTLAPDSDFKSLQEWDSLVSVSTVAMIYAEYDVQVSGDELMGCDTLSDLMKVIEEKQATVS